MKCCTQNLAIVLWHLVQACLSLSDDAGIRRRYTSGDSNLVKKVDLPAERSKCYLKFLALNGLPYILITSKNGKLGVMNRMVYESKNIIHKDSNVWDAKEIIQVPEGTFEFPAFAALGGAVSSSQKGTIHVFDATDTGSLKSHLINEDNNYDFADIVWINKDIIACKIDSERTQIVYIKSKEGGKRTEPWQQTTIAELDRKSITRILLFKNVWNNHDAIFAIDRKSVLLVMWPEDEDGKIVDWQSTKVQLKTQTINPLDNLGDMTLADVNQDGRLDLLVAFRVGEWSVSAYVIPNSADFKKPDTYQVFPLFSIPVTESKECPNILKTFSPFERYHGKPWLLLGGLACTDAFYAVPQHQDPKNWSYTCYKIEVHDRSNVEFGGMEAADMDEDGFVELFVHLGGNNDYIRAFTFQESFMYLYTGFTTRSAGKPTAPKGSNGSSIESIPSIFVVCSYVQHLILRYLSRIRS